MLKIYDKKSKITFPNMKTYTAREIAKSDTYSMLANYTCVIDIDSDGITHSYYRLANLAAMYEVEERDNPEDTLELVIAAQEVAREKAQQEQASAEKNAAAIADIQSADLDRDEAITDLYEMILGGE